MQKVALYILSMFFCFITVGILCMDIPFELDGDFIGIRQLWEVTKLGLGIIAISCIVEFFVYRYLRATWRKNSPELSVKIVEIENKNYNAMTIVVSCIIPLVSFNFLKLNHWIFLFLLLVVIGLIVCKSDSYYNNPTLALLGYHLYKTEIETQKIEKKDKKESLIIISQKKLSKGDVVQYVMLPDGVGVVL